MSTVKGRKGVSMLGWRPVCLMRSFVNVCSQVKGDRTGQGIGDNVPGIGSLVSVVHTSGLDVVTYLDDAGGPN